MGGGEVYKSALPRLCVRVCVCVILAQGDARANPTLVSHSILAQSENKKKKKKSNLYGVFGLKQKREKKYRKNLSICLRSPKTPVIASTHIRT